MEIQVRNVHEALPKGIQALKLHGVRNQSRNGPVIRMSGPVTTIFERPTERVLFHVGRDDNPFFHFFEALWMLAGRNDVAFVRQFVQRMETFSDDGVTLNGAYGYRWKNWFVPHSEDTEEVLGTPIDQLAIVAERLKADPTDRRSVVGMWDPAHDLGLNSKDLPCNTHIYFGISPSGTLDMTVCCRSNDLIWGLCGANAVHFSVLQEYMAARIGVPVGIYYHVSNNYHAYLEVMEPLLERAALDTPCQYGLGYVEPFPLIGPEGVDVFHDDLEEFFKKDARGLYDTQFFTKLAMPLFTAHLMFKSVKGEAKYTEPMAYLDDYCVPCDWRAAALGWLSRRHDNWRMTKGAASA